MVFGCFLTFKNSIGRLSEKMNIFEVKAQNQQSQLPNIDWEVSIESDFLGADVGSPCLIKFKVSSVVW